MKKIHYTFFILLFCVNLHFISAQGESLFEIGIIHEIYIDSDDPEVWSTLISNYSSSSDVPYIMASVIIDGEMIDSVGVRLKGFSSFWYPEFKKSIKLDFNEFVPGKKYDGLKKVNLNNGEGDPSLLRDKICYDVFNKSGVAAARTAYSKVYINGTYWGLYVLVEQIDKTFINDHFSNPNGNLFKNMDRTKLEWLGSNVSDYQAIFDLKSGDSTVAWPRFVNLIDVINNSSDAEFKEAIDEVFDVDRYLKVLAVDVATSNWDSYIDNGRNFYLYENPISLKFQWIPWDYNFALGGEFSDDFFNPNTVPIDDPSACSTILDGSAPYPATDSIFMETINRDNSCCHFGWDQDCQELYDKLALGPVDPATCPTILSGSCPYPATDSIFIQVIAIDEFCCTTDWGQNCQNIYNDIQIGNGPGEFEHFEINQQNSEKVLIARLLAVPEFKERYFKYWCDLLDDNLIAERLQQIIESNSVLIRDAIYDDPNYIFTTELFEEDILLGNFTIPGLGEYIHLRIPELGEKLSNLITCSNLVSTLETGDIVINEFMASNDSLSGISDPSGAFDDWIELYNNTDATIDLSSAYLTDDKTTPKKWAFPPNTNINAGGYLIIWADDQEGEEGLHANFKLAKDGEFIMLSDFDTVLDSLSFDPQSTNFSSSRIPNGAGEFSMNPTTFNGENIGTSGTTNHSNEAIFPIKVFPKPTSDYVNVVFNAIPSKGTVMQIFNNIGQRVILEEVNDIQQIVNLEKLRAGIFILSIDDKAGNRLSSQRITVIKN